MLKKSILIMLCIAPFLFFGVGYVGSIDFGQHTLVFGGIFFLIWMLCLMIYLLIPKQWGLHYKVMTLFACFMTFAQFTIQVDLRSRGIIPDNNWLSILGCIMALIITFAIYLLEKRINGGSS